MSVAEFIREGFPLPRLKESGYLVVYDANRRYRDRRLGLTAEKVRAA
jgi:hypothetical protein